MLALAAACGAEVEPNPPPPAAPKLRLEFTAVPERAIAGEPLGEVRLRVLTAEGALAIAPALTIELRGRDERGSTSLSLGTVTSADGVASISSLILQSAGNYRLLASAVETEGATSEIITVETGLAGIAFYVEPRDTVAGEFISPSVEVELIDAEGVRANIDGVEIRLEWSRDNFPTGQTETATTVGGVARFSRLSASEIGTEYRLAAHSGSFRPKLSRAFSILAKPAVTLRWVSSPSTAVVRYQPWPVFQVELLDGSGARVLGDSSTELSVNLIEGSSTLQGPSTVLVDRGLATIQGLSYDRVETVRIAIAAVGFAPIESEPIVVRRLEEPLYRMRGPGPDQPERTDHPSLSFDGGRLSFFCEACAEADGRLRTGMRVADFDHRLNLDLSLNSNHEPAEADDELPWISRDGQSIVFESEAANYLAIGLPNVPDVMTREISTGQVELAGVYPPLPASRGTRMIRNNVSDDGRRVVFLAEPPGAEATGEFTMIYLRDLDISTTELVARTGGASTWVETAALSGDGRTVLFDAFDAMTADDENTVRDVYVTDPNGSVYTRVSREMSGELSTGDSCCAAMTRDARFIAYTSSSDVLVPGDTNTTRDVFLFDRLLGVTERISVSSAGVEGNAAQARGNIIWILGSQWPSISDDARFVVFISTADNLVEGDNNQVADAFLRDRWTGTTVRLSVSLTGIEANFDTRKVVISGDGTVIAFLTAANTIVASDTNGDDIFVIPNPLYP